MHIHERKCIYTYIMYVYISRVTVWISIGDIVGKISGKNRKKYLTFSC